MIPRLFAWPPVRDARGGDRAARRSRCSSRARSSCSPPGSRTSSTGTSSRFDFVEAHYYAAVVFVAALAVHLVVKVPVALRAYRARGVLAPLRDGSPRRARARRRPRRRRARPADDQPARAARGGRRRLASRCSSRTPAQSIGGPLRAIAFLAPRGARAASRSTRRRRARRSPRRWWAPPTGSCSAGGRPSCGSRRDELLALPQATHTLTLGCVEGWSTRQTLDRRAARASSPGAPACRSRRELRVESLQPRRRPAPGDARAPARSPTRARCSRCGSTARTCRWTTATRRGSSSPALPGVHNTKWVGRLDVPRMRARYGASPLHLLAHLAALALAAWALLQALAARRRRADRAVAGRRRRAARSRAVAGLHRAGPARAARPAGRAGRTTSASRSGSPRCSCSCSSP